MAGLPQTRNSLLLRLADQSQDAWVEFVRIYEQSIIAFARRRGLQEADALDLAQEVLHAVELKLVDWNYEREKGTFRGWIFRVARNIAVDKTMARLRNPITGMEEIHEVSDSGEHDHDDFDLDFAREVLAWAIEKAEPHFSKQSWNAFWLSAIKQMKPKEVSEATGLSIGNVYAARCRVVAKLKKLARQFELKEKNTVPEENAKRTSINYGQDPTC